MKSESLVFAVAGMCFGVILGWVLGSQQASRSDAPVPGAPAQTAAPQAQVPPLDEARVQQLRATIATDPGHAGAHAPRRPAHPPAPRPPPPTPPHAPPLPPTRPAPPAARDAAPRPP